MATVVAVVLTRCVQLQITKTQHKHAEVKTQFPPPATRRAFPARLCRAGGWRPAGAGAHVLCSCTDRGDHMSQAHSASPLGHHSGTPQRGSFSKTPFRTVPEAGGQGRSAGRAGSS